MSTWNLPPGLTTQMIDEAFGDPTDELCDHGLWHGEGCEPCKKANHEMLCPNCHGTKHEFISGQFETGVVAPDGGRESYWEEFYQCEDCGACFEEGEAE